MLRFFNSDYFILIFSVVFVAVFLKWLNKFVLSKNALPPGPWINVPFFGYLPFVDKWLYLTMSKLAHRYGRIFSLYFGSTFVVVVNDYKLLQDTFRNKSEFYSDRPNNNPFKFTSEKFFASDNGKEWSLHRRFMDKYMKMAGVGRDVIESSIMDEIQIFLNNCETLRLRSDTIDLEPNLSVSLINNAFTLLFGYRFDYDDPQIRILIEDEFKLTNMYQSEVLSFFVPIYGFFRRLLQPKSGIEEIKALGAKFDKFSDEIIQDHIDNPEKYTNDDYISAFLNEQKISHEQNIFTKKWLIGILHPMFGGSAETSLSVLQFAILATMSYSDLQVKIHQELDNFIGDRIITFHDRHLTPLTWATLLEVQRVITPLPLGIARSNFVETKINDYRIPMNSYIIPNLWFIHNDPKLWEKPEEFCPQRFIINGEVVKPPFLIPFGIGKRSCPGETLATAQLYLYFASLLQNYEFHPVNGIQNLPLLQPTHPSLVHTCPKYELKLVKRKSDN